MTFPLRAQALSAITALGVVLIGAGAFIFMPQLRGPEPEDLLLAQDVEVYVSNITSTERTRLSSIIPLLSAIHAKPEQTVAFVTPNNNTLGSITFTPSASGKHGFDIQAEPTTLTSLLVTSGATLGKNEYFTLTKHAARDAAFIYMNSPSEALTLPAPLSASIASPIAISSSGAELNVFWPHHTNNQKRDASPAYEIPLLENEVLRIESTNLFQSMQRTGALMDGTERLGAIGLLQQSMTSMFGPALEPQASLLSLINAPGTLIARSGSSATIIIAGRQQDAGTHLQILKDAAATDAITITTIDRLFNDEFAFKALQAETGSGSTEEMINGWNIQTIHRGNGTTFVTAERDDLFLLGTDEDGIRNIVANADRMPAIKGQTERGRIHFSLFAPYKEWIDLTAIRTLFPKKDMLEWELKQDGRLGTLRLW